MTTAHAPRVTKADIIEGLRRAGLAGGEVVLVHSSLNRFGQVDGGADAVIEAVLEAIGPGGTAVFTALTITAAYTEAHVRAALAGKINRDEPMFDVRNSPTWAGKIPETFRTMPGVIRSWHPTHSVSAVGPLAGELLAEHHLRPSCGLDSPYERITRLDEGRVLLLGVSHETNTTMHCIEELRGHEYMLHQPICRIPFIDPDGRERLAETTLHRWHIERELGRLEAQYINAGAETVTLIGAAPVRLCRAKPLREITLAALEKDPFALLTERGKRQWQRMVETGNRIDPTDQ